MIRILLAVGFFCLVPGFLSSVHAQDTDSGEDPDQTFHPVLSGIAISGNTLTKSEIILRELTLHIGDTLTPEAVEYMKSRVYSLGLFNKVRMTYPPVDSTVLLVDVEERWYIWAYPVFGIAERDWSKWYYGGGVRHDNFRGWNERILAQCVLGYNPIISLAYQNPWIFGAAEMYSETSLGYSRTQDKSAQTQVSSTPYEEKHWFFNQTIGNDVFVTVGASARYDTRDLAEYPLYGTYAAAAVSKYGIGFEHLNALIGALDLRVYRQLFSGWVLAGRTFARLSGGSEIPNYLHSFFGFEELREEYPVVVAYKRVFRNAMI